MSLASLRDAIISQFALVNHTQTSRKFIPPAVTPPALSQDWQSPADPNAYHPQRAMAECIANAVEPEITNRVDLNVKQRFDPTPNLPVGPSVGDVYLATATARGWTINRLYTWNGTTYDETVPAAGMQIWIVATGTASISTGTEWVDLEASSGSLSGTVSPIFGALGPFANYNTQIPGYVYATRYFALNSFSATRIAMCVKGANGPTNWRLGVYASVAGDTRADGGILAYTADIGYGASFSMQTYVASLNAPFSVVAGNYYWLGFQTSAQNTDVTSPYPAQVGQWVQGYASTYPNWPTINAIGLAAGWGPGIALLP